MSSKTVDDRLRVYVDGVARKRAPWLMTTSLQANRWICSPFSRMNRTSRRFLFPGIGYGGSCFPKDTRALLTIAGDKGVNLGIVQAAVAAIERQKEQRVGTVDLTPTLLELLGLRVPEDAQGRSLARRLGSLIDEAPDFERLAPVPLSIVCFRYVPAGFEGTDADLDPPELPVASLVRRVVPDHVVVAGLGTDPLEARRQLLARPRDGEASGFGRHSLEVVLRRPQVVLLLERLDVVLFVP